MTKDQENELKAAENASIEAECAYRDAQRRLAAALEAYLSAERNLTRVQYKISVSK